MKQVKIMQGPHKGKTGLAIGQEGSDVKVIIKDEIEPVKVPVNWVKVMGFMAELLMLISKFFSRKNKANNKL